MSEPAPTHGTRTVVSPGKTLFGIDASERVGEYADRYGTKALLLASQEIYDIHGDRIVEALESSGVETVLYTDVRPDPTVENVREAFQVWREKIVTLSSHSAVVRRSTPANRLGSWRPTRATSGASGRRGRIRRCPESNATDHRRQYHRRDRKRDDADGRPDGRVYRNEVHHRLGEHRSDRRHRRSRTDSLASQEPHRLHGYRRLYPRHRGVHVRQELRSHRRVRP